MARSQLAVQAIPRTGLSPAFVAVDSVNGMYFANNGNVFLEVVTTGTATNVTVHNAAPSPDGLTIQDRVVACGATARTLIGPFAPGTYNQPGGNTTVDFSSATGATIAAIQLF